ncbi:zinc-binding dehydrogenase [Novosphingobium aquae]|uniref:Zinc-binding dehydrogenase n=1 Tax=Novosphingobium aquae TaxID=3133435 RepID=A0ABU8S771_9SPHN
MSETYRALRMDRHADTFRAATDIVTLPVTAPGPGEVRVRNLWCGINAIFDTQIARDAVDYVKIGLPTFTGVEALGMVEAVGAGVEGLSVGDAAVTTRFTGGYREENTGPAANFVKVPDARPEWLVLASTGVSALVAMEQIGEIRDGETVAVSAAAGGLGHLLVQLAVLRGCHVIGIAGGPEKCEFVRALGGARVIDYRSEDVAQVLASEYPKGVDLAFDTVSGAIHDAFLANIANHGRLVVAGAASDLDGKPELVTAPRIAHAIYYKSASVRGFMNGLLTTHWPEARARLFDMFRQGQIKVCLDAGQFDGLEGIHDAVEHLLSGKSMGKVLARIAAP